MKKLLSFLLFLITLAPAAHAQRRHSQHDNRCVLRIRLTDGSPFGIIIDGRDYDRSNSSITVGDLPEGKHSLIVYVNYNDNRGRRRSKNVYQGTLRLASTTFNAVTIDAGSGSVDIQSRRMDEQATPPPAPAPRTAYDNRPPVASAFSSTEMDALSKQVEAKETDMDKLSIVKAAIGEKKMSTEQVSLMLGWLAFDSSRLELAKWMQGRVSDPQNYSSLEARFSFDSTKEEFRQLLRGGN